ETIKSAIQSGTDIPTKLFDTQIAAWLLHPDLPDYDFHKIYYGEFRENADDPDQKSAYLRRLKNRLWDKMQPADLLEVFEKIEMPLIPVLAEMELNGIKVDAKGLAKLLKSISARLEKLEKEIYRLAGAPFNINSPQQLGEVLYNQLAINPPAGGRVRKTGKGALSTAAPELEKLRDEHPIIDLILEYRELQKLKTTYIEPFPQLIARDGRIHTTYNQTGTATGRLSSENPNLQNIPIKTELGQEFRKAFVAEDGCQLVSFDYSQLELRIVAHIAKDEKMIEIFRRGEDIHTRTAMEIFEVEPQEVTKKMRRQAKALNFGIIYGMGALGFARAAGVDRQRARQFIDRYFAEFSGVARYMEEIKDKVRRDGYVQTLFGRRRPLLDIYSTMPQIQAGAERAAINHPIQGTAADLMKLAMINADKYLHENFNSADAKLLLQVHDEIVCEVKTDLVEKAAKEIKSIMESVHQLAVPIVAEVKAGDNWQEQKPLTASR
ncbi:MAG: DNA polymerase, partial [Patescibacteria group bacterium]